MQDFRAIQKKKKSGHCTNFYQILSIHDFLVIAYGAVLPIQPYKLHTQTVRNKFKHFLAAIFSTQFVAKYQHKDNFNSKTLITVESIDIKYANRLRSSYYTTERFNI